ncbi:MAG TPA: APC family permease [Candidatus Acidoferrales bacterium]|nr:APC family permease [Candidatus Acidoferrales bacterium]
MRPTRDTRQLNWLLAWAVVFCDIGTSVYYVPGILYGHIKDATPFFVLLTTGGFILLALKYIEISWRNPEGGGVVTITTKAFGPMAGCFGGMLITVDYFLTTAISSVSGFQYIGSIFPALDDHIVLLASSGVVLLAILNIIGIRESATVSLVMAASALVVDLVVIASVMQDMTPAHWHSFLAHFGRPHNLSAYDLLVGFAAAWLAFSGLESISQISPAMHFPLRRTTRRAMLAVMVTMIITSPILSGLSITVLPEEIKASESERFISELGFASGGFGLKLAVVLTASTLLLFAANTAIIGAYHVFLALASRGFLPQAIGIRSATFNTPHVAILIATVIPILVILMTQGHMALLGDLYAFGLLGAFVFSSLSLDVIRWRLGHRHIGFWLGLLTTGMVMLAWAINFVEKDLATLFGGGLTLLGMVTAVGVRDGWFIELLNRIPAIQRLQARAFSAAEDVVEDELRGLVTLAEAVALKPLYRSSTLLAVRGENPRLFQEGIIRARGKGESALYCIYVEEWPGLFHGATPHRPNEEGIRTLRFALQEVKNQNIEVIPIWAISYNAAEAIAKAARLLEVDAVFVGVTRRSAFYHMLRGHVVKGLMNRLPHNCHLMVCN